MCDKLITLIGLDTKNTSMYSNLKPYIINYMVIISQRPTSAIMMYNKMKRVRAMSDSICHYTESNQSV